MKIKMCLLVAFIGIVTRPCPGLESNLEVRIINPKGWNLPDLSKLNFLKNEQVSYPGISINIIAEAYRYEGDGSYYIENYFFNRWKKELDLDVKIRWRPQYCKVYKMPGSEILCYSFYFIEEYYNPRGQSEEERKFSGFEGSATGGIFADLNNDGTYESLFPIGGDGKKDDETIAAVIKQKLAGEQ